VFPRRSGHLQHVSIIYNGQEGVGPNVENLAAVSMVLAQVAEDLYCP